MRFIGRTITLLLMLAPAALVAYLGDGATRSLIAAGVLLVAGAGADAAVVATWRGEHAYAQPILPSRTESYADGLRLDAMRELSGDLEILAGQAEAPFQANEAGRRLDLVLTKPGRNRVAVIKEVRGLRNCGLREAKEIVEGAAKAPTLVASRLPAAEARRGHKALTDAGATVELRDPRDAIR